jgi:hypothetical protein
MNKIRVSNLYSSNNNSDDMTLYCCKSMLCRDLLLHAVRTTMEYIVTLYLHIFHFTICIVRDCTYIFFGSSVT